MRKILLLLGLVVILASCTSQKPLYTWEGYDAYSYQYLKKRDSDSRQELLETYQKIIDDQDGQRNTVPPGIYADYGFLLIQDQKTKEGKEMLAKEIENYPESEIFITRILKMMER